jgi:hypothetical protein
MRRYAPEAPKARQQAVTTITIPSSIHGPRIFTLLGVQRHETRDGRISRVAMWESTCMVCGQPFEITASRKANSANGSRAFTKISCPRHRLTVGEAARLSMGGPTARERFEQIKRAKLECEAV